MVRWTAVTILSVFFLFGNYNFTDLKESIIYYGQSISSTYPTIGSWLLIFIILFIIFSEEINIYFQTIKTKVKLKETFK